MKLSYGIFYTKDIETISRYYQNTVGLEFAVGDEKFVTFKIGDSLLGIKKSDKERESPGFQTIIISVENVEEWHSRLKSRGAIIFSELVEATWGKNFSIIDPDGNRVEFVESNGK